MLSIGGALTSLPYVLIVAAALIVYNFAFENPGIERDARNGYVAIAEKAAAEAQRDEIARQLKAAQDNAAAWQDQLERFQGEADKKEVSTNVEIDEYRKRLAAKPDIKACRAITAADRDWLLGNGKKNP